MFVASVIPAMPLPCAIAEDAAIKQAAEKRICFFVINTFLNLCCRAELDRLCFRAAVDTVFTCGF